MHVVGVACRKGIRLCKIERLRRITNELAAICRNTGGDGVGVFALVRTAQVLYYCTEASIPLLLVLCGICRDTVSSEHFEEIGICKVSDLCQLPGPSVEGDDLCMVIRKI